MSEGNEDVPLDESSDVHDDETPAFEEVEEQMDLSEHVEPVDPLDEAIQRAEKAEKEIAYKDAEIQNVRKRLMAEKSSLIQYGGMGLARRMIPILNDVDRALSQVEDDDESPVAQGLRLLRTNSGENLKRMVSKPLRRKDKNSIQPPWKRLQRFQLQNNSLLAKSSMFSNLATCTRNVFFEQPEWLLRPNNQPACGVELI